MAFGVGESVGSAYVKLYADGSGVPDDVKKAMDDITPELERAGEEHMSAYEKGRRNQMKKDSPKTRDQLIKDLEKGVGKFEGIGEIMGGNLFDGIQLQLTKELDRSDITAEVGQRVRDNLEAEFAKTGSTKLLGQRLKNISAEVVKAQDELLREFIAASKKAEAEAERAAKKRSEEMIKFERETQALFGQTDEMARKSADLIEDVWNREGDVIDRIQQQGAAHDRQQKALIKSLDVHVKKADELDNKYRNFNKTLDNYSNATARAFGKGARNDFINIVGSMVGLVTRLAFVVPKATSSLINMFKGGGGSIDLAKLALNAGSALIGLVAAIAAIVLIAGPAAALISGITAAVISLAASLAFAAAGVGIVAAGIIGILVPAVGIGVLAFKNLDKETKDVAKSVRKEFDGMGKAAGEAIGPDLRKALRIVKPEITGLTPLVKGVSGALGNVAVEFANITKGQPYKRFIDAFTVFLPGAIESLGKSSGQFGEGLMGVFSAARPIINRFLGWLDDITGRFAKWANSPKGQTELLNFFEKAGDSAEKVKNFTDDVGAALGRLFDKGKDDGDTLFQDMSDSLEDFVNYLDDPKNQKAIEDFFTNGKDTAENLGTALQDIKDLIDKYDTAKSREELDKLFTALTGVLDLMGDLVTAWEFLWNHRVIELDVVFTGGEEEGGAGWKRRIEALLPSAKISKFIGGKIRLSDAVSAAGLAGALLGPFRGTATRMFKSIGKVKLREVISDSGVLREMLQPFRGTWKALQKSIGKVKLSDVVNPNGVLGTVLAPFRGLSSDIIKAIGKVNLKDLVDAAGVFAAVVSPFAGLASAILTAIGTIDIGSLIKIPPRGGGVPFVPGVAAGGILTAPRHIYAGEAGPEAIVPLNRPLGQVDASVRELSAIAQGFRSVGGQTNSGGTVVSAGAIVVNEAADGRATATAVLNEYVARVG